MLLLWFLWLFVLTGTHVSAYTRVCNSSSPCIGLSLECSDAGDCVYDCVDEGVCANSSLLCSQSATGGCHVQCTALDSCNGASVDSERHTTLNCEGHSSCLGLKLSVGNEMDNLTMDVSCDGIHSCYHSQFQLHSEGGVAAVHCADLQTNDTETCKDVTVVCDMSANGNCEAAAGGHYACDNADSNWLLCANSELCTADADCFTQVDTATVSFLISNGPLNASTECVAGVRMAAGSELPPKGLLACASLSDAIAKCNELTQTGALGIWAEGVGLSTDLSNAVADSCEFLFATFDDSQPIAVAATSQLEVDYAFGFEAHFYPWQHSVNSALRNALSEAGALLTPEVGVEVNGSFLTVADVVFDSSILIHALNFTAANWLTANMISVRNSPQTAVQFTDISVNGVNTSDNSILHFESVGYVNIVDSCIVGSVALKSSAIYCFDCALALDNCRLLDNSNDLGVVYLKSNSRLSFLQSLCAGNDARNGGCIYAHSSKLFVAHSSFASNSAGDGGAIHLKSNSTALIQDCIFDDNIADGIGGAVAVLDSVTSVANCTFNSNWGNIGGVLFAVYDSTVVATNCRFTANHASERGGAITTFMGSTLNAYNCEFTDNYSVNGGAVMAHTNSPVFAKQCTFSGGYGDAHGGAVYVWASAFDAVNCIFDDNWVTTYGGAVYAFQGASFSASNCSFMRNSALCGGALLALNQCPSVVSNCVFLQNFVTGIGYGGAIYAWIQSPISALNCVFVENHSEDIGGVIFAKAYSTVSALNCDFFGSDGKSGGVAFLYDHSPIFVTNCMFEANTANAGGCIVGHEYCDIVAVNSTFNENTVIDWGAVAYTEENSAISVSNCTFNANSADFGGALYGYLYSPITASNCTFTENSALHLGGALMTYSYSPVSLIDCLFIANTAGEMGGAVTMTTNSEAFVSKCTFQQNTAAANGGALVSFGNVPIVVTNSTFIGNTVGGHGGAVFTDQALSVNTSVFEDNVAANGGAVFRSDEVAGDHPGGARRLAESVDDVIVDKSLFVGNTATDKGGAVYVVASLSMTCTNCSIQDNYAFEGGGIYLEQNAKVNISESNALWNSALLGGFMAVDSDAVVDISDSLLAYNSATRGGCMAIYEWSAVRSERNCYRNNSAEKRGGAHFFDFGNNVYISTDTFEGNRAPDGAHIFADSNELLEVFNSSFLGGQCTNGGLQLVATESLFSDCVFAENSALTTGGALLARYDPGLTLTMCGFNRNTAKFGGAVAFMDNSNARIQLADCQFAANEAENSGAAVAANGQNDNCTFSLSNASFVANVAKGFGGVVAMTEKLHNEMQLVHCEFKSNTAPNAYSAGIYTNAPKARLRIYNAMFANNSAANNGSALFVEAIDSLEATQCSFEVGEDLFVRKAQTVEISENVFGAHSTVTLLNSEKAAIGSLIMEANVMHSTTALRSFPVSLGLEVVENEANNDANVCPMCELTVAVNGTDLFGNEYSPLRWCNLRNACFDVKLEWSEQIADVLADFGTDDYFWQGKGQSTFWLTRLHKHSDVHLSLECMPPTEAWHVCGFDNLLTVVLPVTDCPKDKYQKYTGGGSFECESIGSLSADNYSFIADKNYLLLFLFFAAILALFVWFLWAKDRSIVPSGGPLCCRNRVNGAQFMAPASFAWHCFDFLSDVNLSQSLFRVYFASNAHGYNTATNWQWLALAILSAAFVVLPFGLNLAFVWRLQALVFWAAPNNHFAKDFVKNNAKLLVFACLWCGNLYATLQLVNSRILGMESFHLGLTKPQLRRFLKYRVYNVWTENIPQIIIQVLCIAKDATDGDSSKLSATVLLSFVSSLFSATGIVIENAYAMGTDTDDVEFKATLLMSMESAALTRGGHYVFARNRHKFFSISRALAQTLELEPKQCQLGFVALKGNGCVIYGQLPSQMLYGGSGERQLDNLTCASIWSDILGIASPVTGSIRFFSTARIRRVLSFDLEEDSEESGESIRNKFVTWVKTSRMMRGEIERVSDAQSVVSSKSAQTKRVGRKKVNDAQFVEYLSDWWMRRASLRASGGPLQSPVADRREVETAKCNSDQYIEFDTVELGANRDGPRV